MAQALVRNGTVDYATRIRTGQHDLIADEPTTLGGQDAGPAPYDFLLTSLGACTAITLRMYAKRKGWDLKEVDVALNFHRIGSSEEIRRVLKFDGDLDDGQRSRLAQIAERTPVTRSLRWGIEITTELDPPLAASIYAAELDARLDEALQESFPASDPPSVTP